MKGSSACLLCALALCVAVASGCAGPADDPDEDSDVVAQTPADLCASNLAEPAHVHVPTRAECPQGATLTFANFGRAFIEKHCGGCHSEKLACVDRHGAPLGIDFDTVEQIRARRAHIDALAAAGPAGVRLEMPPSPPAPSAAERHMLGIWLACGAP